MEQNLQGKRVAVLMADGVDNMDYTRTRAFLEEHGARVTLLAPDARPGDYDGLLLAGDTANGAALRTHAAAIAFIKAFGAANKPIAAICHGPSMLIDAGLANARHLTSAPALQAALREAGAEWTDDEVVVDDRLITSRSPDDIPAFNDAFMKELIVAGVTDTGPGA